MDLDEERDDGASKSNFAWMEDYQAMAVDAFPALQGPIVHEGFVPEERIEEDRVEHGVSEISGFTSHSRSRTSTNDLRVHAETTQYNSPEAADSESEEDNYQGFTEDSDGDSLSVEIPSEAYLTNRGGSISNNSDEDDQGFARAAFNADAASGTFAGTRSHYSGQPRRYYALPKTRGGGGRGRGRGSAIVAKGTKRGPRKPVDPSHEFLTLQYQAINAFIDDQDHDKALDLIQKAIAINPEIYAAHALLSEIYFAKGEEDKAVAALFSGAHAAPRNGKIWKQVADICLNRPTNDVNQALEQAAYCFARAVDIDHEDYEARHQRADTNRRLQNYGKAMKDAKKLLQNVPHNPNVLRLVAELCIEINQIDMAKRACEESIRYFEQHEDPDNNAPWSIVNVYVELFAHTGDYNQALITLKRLSRWLLGRKDETYWDEVVEDDREWDAYEPRREEVEAYVPGQYPLEAYGDGLPLELRVKLGLYRLHLTREDHREAFDHFEWLDPDDEDEEAKILEYGDLFLEAAEGLKKAKEYREALRYFEPLYQYQKYSHTSFLLSIGASSYVCGKTGQAIECYEAAKAHDASCLEARTQLSKLYKDVGDRDSALANATESLELGRSMMVVTEKRKYEKREQREQRRAAERALKAAHKMPIKKDKKKTSKPVYNFKTARNQWQAKLPGGTIHNRDPLEPRKRYKSKKVLSIEEADERRTTEVQSLYDTLKRLTEAMRDGDTLTLDTWLDCAIELIADFRSVRVFFPQERHMRFQGYDQQAYAASKRRKWQKAEVAQEPSEPSQAGTPDAHSYQDLLQPFIERTIPIEYRGISFDDWLDVFLEFAMVQAKLGLDHKQQCYDNINAAIDCIVWYHEPESMLQIYACWFTCALSFNDDSTMVNTVARWFMRQYQFRTDAYRLFGALNLLYKYPNETGGKEMQLAHATWRHGPSQKFLFRQLQAVDTLLPQDYNADGEEGRVPDWMRGNVSALLSEAKEDNGKLKENQRFFTGLVKPKEMDVVLLCLYAHILYGGGSYPNALSYFFRAYALDPKNPMVLLSIALSYSHQMFKRQNENRHQYLMQGLAFFEEYARCRVKQVEMFGEAEVLQVKKEVEFNKARLWHMVGLGDLAMKGYEKVLCIENKHAALQAAPAASQDPEEEVPEVDEKYSLEAAYAMQVLYATSGDFESAKQITEKWLVVE